MPGGDAKAYGLFEQACSMEQSYFAGAAEAIGTELVIKPYAYSLLYLHLCDTFSVQVIIRGFTG